MLCVPFVFLYFLFRRDLLSGENALLGEIILQFLYTNVDDTNVLRLFACACMLPDPNLHGLSNANLKYLWLIRKIKRFRSDCEDAQVARYVRKRHKVGFIYRLIRIIFPKRICPLEKKRKCTSDSLNEQLELTRRCYINMSRPPRKPTLWILRNVSTQIGLRSPRRLIRVDTFILSKGNKGIE